MDEKKQDIKIIDLDRAPRRTDNERRTNTGSRTGERQVIGKTNGAYGTAGQRGSKGSAAGSRTGERQVIGKTNGANGTAGQRSSKGSAAGSRTGERQVIGKTNGAYGTSGQRGSSEKAADRRTAKRATEAPMRTKKKTSAEDKKSIASIVGKVIGRFFLSVATLALLTVFGLSMVLLLVFRGPSKTARNVLTMSLTEASATKWIPAIFLGKELTEEIRTAVAAELPDDVTDISQVVIDKDSAISSDEEWKDYPDGIRIETVSGDTYNAYVMIIRDPSRVYLSTSNPTLAMSIPGERIDSQIEKEGAAAAINAGAFFDDGTSSAAVGSVPIGLVFSKGECVWDDKKSYYGFVGLTQENILVVAKTMTKSDAEALNIRDGCCFGPVLIMNGTINETAYNSNSGYNPRTCIGQRADGAILMVCVDGRQAGSLGGTYSDIIDIMVEKGAVNACNLDGGSSTVMLYRDVNGKYGEKGKVQMVNQYSLMQQRPRKMPTFFMVEAEK